MPPKKKGGKKAKAKSSAVVDGISTEEMTKEQLEEHVVRLREELDREREERNYFQMERDQIHTFWEISKRNLDEAKAELRNRDQAIEEAEERHQVEIKVYKQKVKHLLYEHQNNVTEIKVEAVTATKLLQKEHAEIESDLKSNLHSAKVDIKEQEFLNENRVKSLMLKHDEEISNTKKKFETLVREVEKKYHHKMKKLREELELKEKNKIHEIEERKNLQINTLMANHDKAFSEIKNYYNDITMNNLALINSLKEQIDELKKKEERLVKDTKEVQQQNRRLVGPLQKAQEEVADLQKQLKLCAKDKPLLISLKARLKLTESELKDLKWEHEVLEQRFTKVQAERDELYEKFNQAIQEVQQKSGFKNLLLEKKLQALSSTLEQKEGQLNELLSAANLDPATLGVLTTKLEDVMTSKNSAIRDLQYELARACKAHNELLHTCKAKLSAFGIRVDELGFKPLEYTFMGQSLGQGPAGLVSTPVI